MTQYEEYCGGGYSLVVKPRVVVPVSRVRFPLATP